MRHVAVRLWFVLALMAGCGGGESTCECTPACPAKFHCQCGAPTGCFPDEPVAPVDLSAQAGPDSGDCSPACGGTTPYCKAGTCVPCLADDQCPAGMVCKTTGNTTICLPGCASDSRCAAGVDGGAATLKCCGGACVDTARDPANCGACNNACSAEHATAGCSGGQCVTGACSKGWGDCNRDPKDGCETNLQTDIANCTGCGMPCRMAHATVACSDGCYLASCNYGWDDCNADEMDGCETSVLGDARNCGACGTVCAPVPHAQIGCSNGSCVPTQCDPGWSDCNGNAVDGCEAILLTDGKNCGGCGNVCQNGLVCKNGACTCAQCNFPNAKSDCVNMVCKLTACLPGWADCDGQQQNGCEVDVTSDPSNCGGCGVACGQMTPYCDGGKCSSNPCTGKVGGAILQIMGKPMYGFCWYLSAGGATCDDVCKASGGSNMANDALMAFGDDCSGGAQGQPAQWFFENGNACGWTMPNGAPTGYLTLGHGYNNMDQAGRGTVYMGKCNMGGLRNVGVMPGDTNDSAQTGNSRCVVCACSH